jgi:hypothetical protein
MALIDVGPGAIDRNSYDDPGYTIILIENPANDTGVLDVIEVWFESSATLVKVGTFYGTAPNFTSRDYETLGSVASGSKQTFSGLHCDVSVDDLLGVYFAAGCIEGNSLTNGEYWKAGDQFGAGQQSYAAYSFTDSIYATGATAEVDRRILPVRPRLAIYPLHGGV